MFKFLKKNIRTKIYNKRSKIDKKIKKNKIIRSDDLTSYIKKFGNKNPDKIFYVIQRSVGGGMFSNLNYVIHHMKIALDLKYIPIIDMQNFPTKYNENKKIRNSFNAWDYYFEPINKYKLKDVYKSKFVIICDSKTKNKPEFDSFENLNNEHYLVFKKYIKFRKYLVDKSNDFIKKSFYNKKVLGVHFRGTDMKTQERHPFPATYQQIINNINYQIKNYKYNKIFLVTEEKNYLDKLKKYYSKNLLCYNNSFRSNKPNIFEQNTRNNHRYLIGMENILDMLILSNTSKIICTNSHLPDASKFVKKQDKIKLIKIENGNNSKNLVIAQFLWYIKKLLPYSLGGFKKF